ncbi:hypothetical protein HPB48_022461 [Haemaphysalis longicornis]|uniref:Peptidase M13 C-terminal domain-containing protein n=1 Tax=Haemaphysalis longicornis TaxID=44386 RepID=A0A9J6G1R8_HAELO|nr:hypothetical protein HPB48_022461 [Haemaphysalis longicornis]
MAKSSRTKDHGEKKTLAKPFGRKTLEGSRQVPHAPTSERALRRHQDRKASKDRSKDCQKTHPSKASARLIEPLAHDGTGSAKGLNAPDPDVTSVTSNRTNVSAKASLPASQSSPAVQSAPWSRIGVYPPEVLPTDQSDANSNLPSGSQNRHSSYVESIGTSFRDLKNMLAPVELAIIQTADPTSEQSNSDAPVTANAKKHSHKGALKDTSMLPMETLLRELCSDTLSRSKQRLQKPSITWLQLVLASVLGVCLAVVLLLQLLSPHRIHAAPLCRSQACLYHAELIERHVNRSVDPCHDFKAFACSKWTAVGDASSYGTALMRRHMNAWFNGFKGYLKEGTKLIPAGASALQVFEHCMSDIDEASGKMEIGELKVFMKGPTDTLARTSSCRSRASGRPVESRIQLAYRPLVRCFISRISRRYRGQTPLVSADRTWVWNNEIEKNIVPEEGMSAWQDLPNSITVSDVTLIGVINTLYAKYTKEQILEHIAWFFVQAFVALADRKYLVSKYGNKAIADAHRREYCATEVETAYRFLVVSLYTMPRFSIKFRDTIAFQLQSVKEALLEKIASGHPTWADNSSRERVASKVSNLRTSLWPPADLLNETDLLAMYRDFPKNVTSFVDHWFNIKYAERSLLANPRYAPAMKMPLNFVLPYFRYDYVSNSVLVSAAALTRPLYDANGTASMTYGGLGFSYASQLVRAFDDGGMVVDANGNITVDSWASASWKRGSQAKLDCLKPDFNTPFREIPAIEIAHSAFRRAIENDSKQSQRVTLDYTEEQEFFITACFTLCTTPNPSGSFFGGDCNKAARNYAPFAEAFGCRDGAPMKPKKPCSYFD